MTGKLHLAPAVLYLALLAALAVALTVMAMRHGGPVHTGAMRPATWLQG